MIKTIVTMSYEDYCRVYELLQCVEHQTDNEWIKRCMNEALEYLRED